MIYQALPLKLVPLNTQILNLGGEGFNCNVRVTPVDGSYSVLYEFNTPDGLKTLKTVNEFQVGIIDDAAGNYFVMYYPDKFEFSLMRVAIAPKLPGGKILIHTWLGATFPAAMAALKGIFSDRINWSRITPPPSIYS